MFSLFSFVFVTVLLALTSALPHRRSLAIPIQRRSTFVKDGIVNLDALRSHLTYSRGKYLQGLSALQRNTGVTPPSSIDRTLSRRAADTDLLTAEGIRLWYGNISVGSPPVEYMVDFDTGSADLFLPAINCDSTCNGHTHYDPNSSSSSIDLLRDFTLTYGDGSVVTGEQYADTVTFQGFVAKNQTVGAASQYSTNFQSASFVPDGLMGMSFAEISVFQANPVVQTLITEGQLSEPVFTFKLASPESELRIGGVNPSLYTGSFTYTPVTRQGFWQINADSINANGKTILKNVSAVVDTGTTFILGDSKTVGQFYSALNATDIGGGFYTVPCNAIPDVSITIQGKPFSISSDTFNLGSPNSSESSCIGAITAQGSLGDTWILGDVFLRNVYSVFDLGERRVGFADLA